MTIQGPRTDITWVDEIQNWSKFDAQWVYAAAERRVKDPYTQKLVAEMDARIAYHMETERNLKALAQKYLPETDWVPAPEPKPLHMMTREERVHLDSLYFGYYHGAARLWEG